MGLGRSQKLVLNLLAINAEQTVRDLARNWPTLTESSARSAVNRLGDRGLVDFAGWSPYRDARTFSLTDRGRAVADTLVPPDEDDDA